MLKLELNGEDLLKLIEACGKSGVSHLKLGKDIELTFGGQATPTEVPTISQANELAEKAIEVESFAEAEAELRKERLESMKLEDPARFEQLLASGDLVDEENND